MFDRIKFKRKTDSKDKDKDKDKDANNTSSTISNTSVNDDTSRSSFSQDDTFLDSSSSLQQQQQQQQYQQQHQHQQQQQFINVQFRNDDNYKVAIDEPSLSNSTFNDSIKVPFSNPVSNHSLPNSNGSQAQAQVHGHEDYRLSFGTGKSVTSPPSSSSAVPASANSSATPSRSSSTSNRALVSNGSFTPQSSTPPMTPRTQDHVIDNNYQGQAQHPSVVHIATAPSSSGANGAGGDRFSEDAYLSPSHLTSSTNFVTSPTSLQPPTNLMSASGGFDGYQSMYSSSILLGDSSRTDNHQSESNLHRSNTLAASREALLQQQRYQQQQMRQFQETSECDPNSPTPSTTSTKTVGVSSSTTPTTMSIMTTTTLNNEDISTHSASAAQSAIALARATAQASVEPPSLPTSPSYTNTSFPPSSHIQDDYHRRERVISSQGSVFGNDLLHGQGAAFSPSPITRASTSLAASHLITHDLKQTAERSHIEDGSGPVVLMAAVTKGIAERTGWGRFEDSRRVLVTLADTPGLADTEGDDEKNIPILKEYINSVGTRLGITAFLMVFKIDCGVDMIITIMQAFNEIMKDFPNFWDNVILVFTGCDYRRNVMNTKQLYHEAIQAQLQEHFFKDLYRSGGEDANGIPPVVPMVFLTTAESPCGFALGEKCDCKARTTFLNAGIKRLWYAIKNRKRWVLNSDEQDDEFSGHS
ncbi:hypothetical protein BGZ82_008233 [Podila clonocystis]|nr:hypothetical protein BGZ82_008233 [Podila clonocystis]